MESTESPIPIRAAGVADAAALAGLVTHLGYPTQPEAMRRRLERIGARDDYATFVAERDGRVVGFAGVTDEISYNFDPPSVQLLSLVVEPGERGRGTGAALLAEAERWARSRGAEKIHLTSGLHRDGAHRFYERLGYARTGARYLKMLA